MAAETASRSRVDQIPTRRCHHGRSALNQLPVPPPRRSAAAAHGCLQSAALLAASPCQQFLHREVALHALPVDERNAAGWQVHVKIGELGVVGQR